MKSVTPLDHNRIEIREEMRKIIENLTIDCYLFSILDIMLSLHSFTHEI